MVRRQGPQLPSLIYDKAFEADHVMRPEASGLPSRPGTRNCPATGRIDSCIPAADPNGSPCAGDVHRFVEDLDQLGEVSKGAGETVDLIDNDNVELVGS